MMPPYGYCQCGCGEKTTVAQYTNRSKGWTRGMPKKWLKGHSRLGAPIDTMYEKTPDGCWEWTSTVERGGYGLWTHHGKTRLAHRSVYERHVGPIPAGMQLDHLCRNRKCCNPAHLEPVTRRINVRRGANTKLTLEDVMEMRAAWHMSPGNLSKRKFGAEWRERLGVTQYCIEDVLRYRTWKDGSVAT